MIEIILYLLSLIPLRILYFFSDILAFLLYYVLKYRRKVVSENIRNSFPNASEREKIDLEKKFYTNFCDYIVETIKLCSISNKELNKRIKFDYSELEKILSEKKNCHIYLGHQFNWEWANAHLASWSKKTDVVLVYKPLRSVTANNSMLKIRSRFGSKMVTSKNMKKEMEQFSKKQHILILVADQKPKIAQKSFWTIFLNQKTPFLNGTELYTAQKKTPTLYASIIRMSRGNYKFILDPLFNFSDPYSMGVITKKFAQKLETSILSNPTNYLWSHRRWKHIYKDEYNKRWLTNKHH